MQKYRALNEQSVIEYVKELGYFQHRACTAKEIGDGNLNYVFHVVPEGETEGIIVKQALPYAKVVGESWPLTLERATTEWRALKIQGEILSELVPKVYHHDQEQAVTLMEDLTAWKILRTGLIQGENYSLIAKHVGTFIAHTHFFTSDIGATDYDKKGYVRDFYNPELCKITEDLVFTDPFYASDTNNFEEELQHTVKKLWESEAVKDRVAYLKWRFMTGAETLVHGDLHTGSIFVRPNETKVIDPEFAFVGPFGFDLGQFIANILLHAISRPIKERGQYIEIVKETIETFEKEFYNLWNQLENRPFASDSFCEEILAKAWRDTLGFCGCEMIRRTIGLAHVADIERLDSTERIVAKEEALALGQYILLLDGEKTDIKTYIHQLQERWEAVSVG